MMLNKPLALTLLATLAAPVASQTEKPASKPSSHSTADPFATLAKASEADRGAALAAYIDSRLATNAVYSGQYAKLKTLQWSVVPMLKQWVTEPPAGIKMSREDFSNGCVNALRDCVDKPSEELMTMLGKAAKDYLLSDRVRSSAKYALAQFGDHSYVEKLIERAKKNTAAESPQARLRGWVTLSDVYYNIRQYKNAAKAHQAIIAMIEAANPKHPQLASSYYNCGCSLALDGQAEEAMKHVTRALEVGKASGQQLKVSLLKTDMDIQSLRSDPRYAELMSTYFGVKTKQAQSKPTKTGADADH